MHYPPKGGSEVSLINFNETKEYLLAKSALLGGWLHL